MSHLGFQSTHVSPYGMLRTFSHPRGVTCFRQGGGSIIPAFKSDFSRLACLQLFCGLTLNTTSILPLLTAERIQ